MSLPKTQKRIVSKAGWVAVAALIGLILGNYGLYDYIGLTEIAYQKLVDAIFTAITAFGIWNDPTIKGKF